MKESRLAILAAFLLISMFAVVPGVMAQEKQQQMAPKEHSMTGCLEQGAHENTFKLTHVEGGKVPLVEIPESTANLAPHLGHKVEVTGTAIQGTKGVHTMKITAVKMISATCP